MSLAYFSGGAQKKYGKVAVKGDSLSMDQLRQKWAITLLLDYYHYIISYYILYQIKYWSHTSDQEACCYVTPSKGDKIV